MKKLLLCLCAITLVFSSVALADASPITFSETFLGGAKSSFTLWQCDWAEFEFDLTGKGGHAKLLNKRGPHPTEDETSYDPNVSAALFSASLNFQFSSTDSAEETVEISAWGGGGSTPIATKTYALGNGRELKYDELSIDLAAAGLLSFLEDGRLLVKVVAPFVSSSCSYSNDFTIEWANLSVQAANPVPEPATMLLLGTGLIGLVGLGRKKVLKKS